MNYGPGAFTGNGTGGSPGIRRTSPSATAFQYDYLTAGSGIGNVFVNAKWLFKISGMYQLPARRQRLGVLQRAAGLSVRARSIHEPVACQRRRHRQPAARQRSAIAACPPIRTSTSTSSGRSSWEPSGSCRRIDVFNVCNSNTEQAIRGTQNSSNANFIQAVTRAARATVRRPRELVSRTG